MRFGVLGPVLVHDGEAFVHIGPPRQRTLLAALTMQAGRAVPAEKLAQALWDGGPSAAAAVTLRTHVMRLRQVLGPKAGARVLTRSGSYQLEVGEDEVDHLTFAALCSRGGVAVEGGDWRLADSTLSEALRLWRGAPLADVASESLRGEGAPYLEQLHLQALEWRNEAQLSLARHAELLTELQALAAENPLRERFQSQLMLVLYRCGRQADALAVFQRVRRLLAEELGIEPGPELQELHQRVLCADRSLDLRHPAIAASASPEVVPHQLPPMATNFAGRERELEALTCALDQPDTRVGARTPVISAISGTAGVGKTALAVQWAHRLAERFPDGQLYLNLRGYDPGLPMTAADALARFLRDLGVAAAEVPADEEERSARYRSLLSGRQMLILLDNASEAGQVRPLLPASPGCAAIVTSRDTLAGLVARDGARRIDLDVLADADAVNLLRTLVGDRVNAEPYAAAALVEYCCRLPLALRVAAELAAARPTASLASLASELADQQQRLDLLDAGGDPSTAVRAVFSGSIRNLDDGAARAFRLLGLHPGPEVDAYAVAALIAASLKQARQLLNQLLRAHLIQAARPGRYAMHDLLRDYARERAATEDGREAQLALTRLFDYYLSATVAATETLYPAEQHQSGLPAAAAITPFLAQPAAARTWLAAELPCLAAVTVHAAAAGWPRHAMGFSAALFRYLDAGGHGAEAVTIHDQASRAARIVGDLAAEARGMTSLGITRLAQGCYQDAARHLEQALPLSRRAGDRDGEARALANLGSAALWQGRYSQAADSYRIALGLYRETGNGTGEAIALNNLGIAELRLGSYEQAGDHLHQALNLARDIGDQAGEAYGLLSLAEVSVQLGSHEQAGGYLRQALNLCREICDLVGEAHALANLGELDLRQGHVQQAASHLEKALKLSRDIGERSVEGAALNSLGEVSLASGDYQQARIHHTGALALASDTGHKREMARAHAGLAHAHHAGRDLDQARYHWQRALVLYTEMSSPEAEQVRDRLAGTGEVLPRGLVFDGPPPD
jgi:DNA-binding SARP family transcriptional activator/Tfp pilus assembly protein PilF